MFRFWRRRVFYAKAGKAMLDKNRIPRHVAIIMDGNGRWAKAHGVPRLAGHNAGGKSMIEVVRRANDIGVKYLTVYAFSTENWKRSAEEVSGIFRLLIKFVESELRELMENNVRVCILGDYSPLPKDARKAVDKGVSETAGNTGLQFNIALNYGARDEIRRSVEDIAAKVKAGQLEPEDVTEELIAEGLWTGKSHSYTPDPELIIRTSGEERLSNFLLWQGAYSEFVFTDVLWPDFTPEEYEKCIAEYQSRDRRFGGR